MNRSAAEIGVKPGDMNRAQRREAERAATIQRKRERRAIAKRRARYGKELPPL